MSTTDDGYNPIYAIALEEHLEEGLSLESFVGVVRQDLEIIKGWIDTYPEMAAAYKYGEAKARMTYEKIGLDGVKGNIKGFSHGAFKLIMEERFNYGQKKNVEPENPNKPHTIVYFPTAQPQPARVVESKFLSLPEPRQQENDPSNEFKDDDE